MSRVTYSAVVLIPLSQTELLTQFPAPAGWQTKAHHMTINLGSLDNGPAANLSGKKGLTVVAVASDDRVMAVKVECGVPSTNKIKHITIAVNTAGGGMPVHSNELTDWKSVSPVTLEGFIAECGSGDIVVNAP